MVVRSLKIPGCLSYHLSWLGKSWALSTTETTFSGKERSCWCAGHAIMIEIINMLRQVFVSLLAAVTSCEITNRLATMRHNPNRSNATVIAFAGYNAYFKAQPVLLMPVTFGNNVQPYFSLIKMKPWSSDCARFPKLPFVDSLVPDCPVSRDIFN